MEKFKKLKKFFKIIKDKKLVDIAITLKEYKNIEINISKFKPDTSFYHQYQSVMAFAIFEPQESIIIRRQSTIKFE